MDLKIPFRYYHSAFSEDECNSIINIGKGKINKAFIDTDQNTPTLDESVRNCEVSWLNEPWIYEKIYAAILDTNEKAGWKWNIDCIELLQFTKYGLNEHYDWHCDGFSDFLGIYKNNPVEQYNGKVRKISVTVNLVDGNEYEGGDLLFSDPKYLNKDFGILGEKQPYTINEIRNKGTIIVFPSFTYHKVTPVTRGTRYSLVTWALGNPWQ
jgi:PKHD-type hydroxylase|tara:strand:+ start:336 stop:965 length:630 start_codon:yes stop_codon:yes gene_type:complete